MQNHTPAKSTWTLIFFLRKKRSIKSVTFNSPGTFSKLKSRRMHARVCADAAPPVPRASAPKSHKREGARSRRERKNAWLHERGVEEFFLRAKKSAGHGSLGHSFSPERASRVWANILQQPTVEPHATHTWPHKHGFFAWGKKKMISSAANIKLLMRSDGDFSRARHAHWKRGHWNTSLSSEEHFS